VPARHVGGGPGLVEEDQMRRIERRLAPDEDPPFLGYVEAILLGGVKTLFLA